MKKAAIIQSFYIPWKGYFDIINSVDEFILFDDMQYPRRFWVNRNRIKTPEGFKWLSIPVKVKGKFHQPIKDVKIDYPGWNMKHWETIKRDYSKAPCFKHYSDIFEELYLGCEEEYISRINYRFISKICELLGIKTKISWSMDYNLVEGKTERLVELCRQAGADEYISGPAAKAYIEKEKFKRAGIKLTYFDYSGYEEYTQLYPPFIHEVSVIDLIFNTGDYAKYYLKS
ncbi:WbqC family protein [bacterium]|nr:WbqC family protein [bacterium]